MSSVEIKMRFNADTEEVETLVDGKVLVSSGKDTFASWVDYHNEKHKPTVAEPVEEKVVTPAAPVEDETVSVDNPVTEEVDDSPKE